MTVREKLMDPKIAMSCSNTLERLSRINGGSMALREIDEGGMVAKD